MQRLLFSISLVVFGCTLFTRSTDPIIPKIADGFGIAASTAALLSTAYALPYAIVQPILGAAADTLGKSRLMIVCLMISVLAALASAAALTFPMLMATRVFAGAVSGGVFPVGVAIVGDLFPIAQRQVAISRVVAAGMLGNLLGASVSGAVGDLWGWRGAFLVTGLISAATLVPSRSFQRHPELVQKDKPQLSSIRSHYRAIFTNPLAKVCFGVVFFDAMVIFGLFPYIATLLEAQGETSATVAGVIIAGFGVGAIVYSAIVHQLLRLVSDRWLMAIGGFVMAACLNVIPLQPAWPLETINFLIMGVAFFLLHGGVQVYVTELAPMARGSAMALHSSSFFFGQAMGPIVYGLGFAHLGETRTFAVSAVVIVAASLWAALALRHHVPNARPTTGSPGETTAS